jgi:methylamine utilization protein MauE
VPIKVGARICETKAIGVETLIRSFVLSAGVILLTAGTAKLVSVFGSAQVLEVEDPIFGISYRYLMIFAGVLELAIGSSCLFNKARRMNLGLVAWLATGFLAYRVGLWFIGWRGPCACLGNLADALRISPDTVDVAMKILLGYLLLGGLMSWKCLNLLERELASCDIQGRDHHKQQIRSIHRELSN